MKEEHILISSDGPDRNVLKLKPPMVFTTANVDQLVATLDRVLGEVTDTGVFTDNKAPGLITADLHVETKKMKFAFGDIEVSLYRS